MEISHTTNRAIPPSPSRALFRKELESIAQPAIAALLVMGGAILFLVFTDPSKHVVTNSPAGYHIGALYPRLWYFMSMAPLFFAVGMLLYSLWSESRKKTDMHLLSLPVPRYLTLWNKVLAVITVGVVLSVLAALFVQVRFLKDAQLYDFYRHPEFHQFLLYFFGTLFGIFGYLGITLAAWCIARIPGRNRLVLFLACIILFEWIRTSLAAYGITPGESIALLDAWNSDDFPPLICFFHTWIQSLVVGVIFISLGIFVYHRRAEV